MKTNQIEICDFTVFSGRNIYSHRPVIKMIVDVAKYGNIPTNKIPGFNDNLLKAFPGLKKNHCSLGFEGGFLVRLNEGTYIAHVLEHVILEMQFTLGYNVKYGKTRTLEEPSLYYLVYEYENEVCGQECGKAAVFIINYLLSGKELKMDEFWDYLKKVSLDAELGPSTGAIVSEAKKRGIPVTRIGNESLVRLGYGRYSRLVESTLTDSTSCISADISCNKQLTKYILSENKIPVPFGKVVYSAISAQMVAESIKTPVVIKPFDGNQGKGVHLNLKSKKEIEAAFKDALRFSKGIIVEKFITGRDFRILVVGNKVRAVSERLPASVTGDGVHTVKELVNIVNLDPNRGEQHEKILTKICIDNAVINKLKKNNLTPESVIPEGLTVRLRENGNMSTGGTAIDCTDIIHPENAELCVRAAKAIGIDIAGIDIVSDDITKSVLDTGGAIVEVNTAPGIRMHLYPGTGKPRNVARDIVNHLYPTDDYNNFPIVSVTGTNGKTTVVRLISHVLSLMNRKVGMTSTSGTFINGECICRGDNSGPRSARALLANKEIDAAVFETARGGIIREGLGYDLADVGVITNITDDHLGIDGVNSIEDLAHIKSLVVEAVKNNGAAVLNALDRSTPLILKRINAKPVLFYAENGLKRPLPDIKCPRVFAENGFITIEDNGFKENLIKITDIKITCGGLIECNIENSLAAVSALYALSVPSAIIKAGLKSFSDNKGRFNLYETNGALVMLDYGHNEAGYSQVIKTCEKIDRRRLVGIVGMPGDRMDSAVTAVGKLCAGAFDAIYIKEDDNLRGRRNGEVAGILYNSIIQNGYSNKSVIIVKNELDALKKALSNSVHGDLVVVFYEKLDPIVRYLEEIKAVKLSDLSENPALMSLSQA